MIFDFSAFKNRIEEIRVWFSGELALLRTGRATPALLDSVKVESYGQLSPVGHLASVSVENARTIKVTPWDKLNFRAIERAIQSANLGVSVSAAGSDLRVNFPELTTERRQALVKIVGEKLESARKSLRGEREEVLGQIEQKEKIKEISEDDRLRMKNELQKLVDEANKDLESLAEKKKKELQG